MDATDNRVSTRVLRACENCRERKVKCNGKTSGCQQCAHLNLRCVYKAIDASAKSRVKAGRGSVLARLKGGRQASKASNPLPAAAATSSTAQAPGWGERSAAAGVDGDNGDGIAGTAQASSSINAPGGFPSSEFPQAFFTALVDPYDEYIYCVSPVVTAAEIRAAIANMHRDPYDFMLVHAFGAVTVNLTQPKWTSDPLEMARFKRLLDVAVNARSMLSTACFVGSGPGGGGGGGGGGGRGGVRPMLAESFIMATIFIEMSLMAIRRHDEAFLMLREAISLIQILQMEKTRHRHDADTATATTLTKTGPQSPEQTAHAVQQRAAEAKWQRLYWEAFIHERFSAIVDFRPIVLDPLRDSVAAEDETLPVQIREWLRGIVQIFSVIDHEFVRYWLGTSPGNGPDRRAVDEGSEGRGQQQSVRDWIERKKKQLDSLDFMLQRTVNPSSILPPHRHHRHHHHHHTSPPTFPEPQHVYDSISPRSMYHEMDLHHSSMSAASPASTIGSSIHGNSLATENWSSLTTMQQADLVITRQWMLTLLWQLALSHCVLTSSSSTAAAGVASTTATISTTQKAHEEEHSTPTSDARHHRQTQEHAPSECTAVSTGPAATTTSDETDDSATSAMSLSFPVRLSQQLRALILQLGRLPIERHGSGIRQKLFEITTTFADVIVVCTTAEEGMQSQAQGQNHPLQIQQQQRFDDFAFLYEFLRDFAGLDEVQAQILGDKAELVRGVQRGR